MKDENVFFRNLNNLDDADVEKISETVPALDKKAQKRILEKCMSRMADIDSESDSTVSGTEKYSRAHFIRYISTAVACLLAVIGIGGMITVSRNITPDDISPAPQYTAVPVPVTESNTASVSSITSETSTAEQTVFTETTVTTEVQTEEQVTAPMTEQVTETIAEPSEEVPAEETAVTDEASEPSDGNVLFDGKYGDKTEIDYGTGSSIEITETGDNSYNIYIGFFRVMGFEVTGSVNNNGILIFTTQNQPEIYGELVFEGEIRLNDDGCILTITKSENNPVNECGEIQYYRIS